MRKPLSVVLIGSALLLAVFMTAFAAPSQKALGETSNAHVSFFWSPQKIVCIGETASVGVMYYWKDETPGFSGETELAPLTPLKGTLTVSSQHGVIDNPSKSVSIGPGLARLTYTAETEGDETLIATVDYGDTDTEVTSFKVRQCNYKITILATSITQKDGVNIYVMFKGEGNLSVQGDQISGEVPTKAEYGVSSMNPAVECYLDSFPDSQSTMLITGTVEETLFGSTTIHLKVKYEPFATFEKANQICNDRIKREEISNGPFLTPENAEVDGFLLSNLDFEDMTPLQSTFGPDGWSVYELSEL